MTTVARPVPPRPAIHPSQMGMWVFLATISMLFAAFTSAYIIRRVAADWVPIALPRILWLNTAILLGSSIFVELARKAVGGDEWSSAKRWLRTATLIGLAFLGGQMMAWRILVAAGVFVPTSPHSSFFYIFTGVHGLHLLGGLLLLLWTTRRIGGPRPPVKVDARRWLDLAATYWHFLGGLWVFLLLVLWAL